MLGLAITMVMAPTGQASAQRLWPMHLCPLTMTALPPSMAKNVALRTDRSTDLATDAVRGIDVGVLRARAFRIHLALFSGEARPGFAAPETDQVDRDRDQKNQGVKGVDENVFRHRIKSIPSKSTTAMWTVTSAAKE